MSRVSASTIVLDKLKFDGKETLTIDGTSECKLSENVHLVGWGREAFMMANAVERLIGDRLKKGLLVVPRDSLFSMWKNPQCFPNFNTKITFMEAGGGGSSASGQPDKKSAECTASIVDYCTGLTDQDTLIVILTSGTESLLCLPKDGIQLRDKINVIERLRNANATQREIAKVRSKLSQVRGSLNFPSIIN